MDLADRYRRRLEYQATPIGHDSWLFLTVASTVWASRAIDHSKSTTLQRSALRAYARELKVGETLKLTPEAEKAIRRAEQKRRQDAWKGPKNKAGE